MECICKSTGKWLKQIKGIKKTLIFASKIQRHKDEMHTNVPLQTIKAFFSFPGFIFHQCNISVQVFK